MLIIFLVARFLSLSNMYLISISILILILIFCLQVQRLRHLATSPPSLPPSCLMPFRLRVESHLASRFAGQKRFARVPLSVPQLVLVPAVSSAFSSLFVLLLTASAVALLSAAYRRHLTEIEQIAVLINPLKQFLDADTLEYSRTKRLNF